MCPYCRSKNLISEEDSSKEIHEAEQLAMTGRYEEAALKYEKVDLWDKAKECRRVSKKKHDDSADLPFGKVGEVSMICPHCGASKPVNPRMHEETCSRCGTTYAIPDRIREVLDFEEKS
jgi:hypothetical protein